MHVSDLELLAFNTQNLGGKGRRRKGEWKRKKEVGEKGGEEQELLEENENKLVKGHKGKNSTQSHLQV